MRSVANCYTPFTFTLPYLPLGGSVAEWLACWTQAQKGLGSNRSCDAVSSTRQHSIMGHAAEELKK